MHIRSLGIAADGGLIDGRLGRLREILAYIEALGFDHAEIPVEGVSAVINGHLHRTQLDRVLDVLGETELHYTVHAPNRLNLAFGVDDALERAVFEACLQFSRAIGSPVMVYHSGLQALNAARVGRAPLPDPEGLARGAEREVESLQALAPVAAELGVVIAMENGDSHWWEHATLHREGQPADRLAAFHPRLRIPPIVEQIQAVDHPNVGMTLDFGHLYIASKDVGFDYLEAVRQAAPFVRHLHMNDNFGKLDVGYDAEKDRLPYGEADLHLPPGWGSIPLAEALACLQDYDGYLTLEIKPRFYDHFGEALANARELLTAVDANSG